MEFETEGLRLAMAVIAVVAFNVPIAVGAIRLRALEGFGGALCEKDAVGEPTGTVSYSRVTGMIGAVVVASLFWIMSNIAIALAILSPRDLPPILSSVSGLFYVGAALFIPYAFNQLKTLLQ